MHKTKKNNGVIPLTATIRKKNSLRLSRSITIIKDIISKLSNEELDSINNILTQTEIPFYDFIKQAEHAEHAEKDKVQTINPLIEHKLETLKFVSELPKPQELSEYIIERIRHLTPEQLETIYECLV